MLAARNHQEPHFGAVFFRSESGEVSMSEVLQRPTAVQTDPFEPAGMTLGAVVRRIEKVLRATENEPEWLAVANSMDDAMQSVYGLLSTAPWPETGGTRARLRLSVERGNSEGWIIQTDYVRFVEPGWWKSQPLIRIKSLTRQQAWAIAAIVSRMLDID
jgi:hypothetical protein